MLREAEVLDRSDFGGAIRYPGCVRLDRLADEAVARADTLARAGIGDLCVDTGGKTAEESAREIRDRIGWA